jgi:hypothetical protein
MEFMTELFVLSFSAVAMTGATLAFLKQLNASEKKYVQCYHKVTERPNWDIRAGSERF